MTRTGSSLQALFVKSPLAKFGREERASGPFIRFRSARPRLLGRSPAGIVTIHRRPCTERWSDNVARGLLSRLASSDPSRSVDEIHSIVGNLRALLNTRLGDAMSSRGFGVVDFVDLVHEFPGAGQVIQRSIRNTIAEFEPRLRNVRVRLVQSGDPLSLAFEVSARLAGDKRRGLVRVRTEMSQGGRVKVE